MLKFADQSSCPNMEIYTIWYNKRFCAWLQDTGPERQGPPIVKLHRQTCCYSCTCLVYVIIPQMSVDACIRWQNWTNDYRKFWLPIMDASKCLNTVVFLRAKYLNHHHAQWRLNIISEVYCTNTLIYFFMNSNKPTAYKALWIIHICWMSVSKNIQKKVYWKHWSEFSNRVM